MPDILHRVGIDASDEKVFKALSEEKGLADWWTRNVTAPPGVGVVLEFRFNDKGYNAMKVLELTPGKRVRWQCVDGAKEWIGTELTFDLREKDGTTVLLFAQRGWKEQVEFYLLGLKNLVPEWSKNSSRSPPSKNSVLIAQRPLKIKQAPEVFLAIGDSRHPLYMR